MELTGVSKYLVGRFPDIGEFELRPHAMSSWPPDQKVPGVTLHLMAPLSEADRVHALAVTVEHDPALKAMGINDVAFTLWGPREDW